MLKRNFRVLSNYDFQYLGIIPGFYSLEDFHEIAEQCLDEVVQEAKETYPKAGEYTDRELREMFEADFSWEEFDYGIAEYFVEALNWLCAKDNIVKFDVSKVNVSENVKSEQRVYMGGKVKDAISTFIALDTEKMKSYIRKENKEDVLNYRDLSPNAEKGKLIATHCLVWYILHNDYAEKAFDMTLDQAYDIAEKSFVSESALEELS